MSIKLVFDAGHWYNEAGRRCLKSLDKNETREWSMNDRIADKLQTRLAAEYIDVQVLRVDDTTGKTFIDVDERAKAANKWGADLYCSFHHNAGVNGTSGGGITVMTYDDREELVELRNKLYDCLLKAGGIRGNRSTPKYSRPDLCVLRETNMRAVLVEHGFMDSKVDVPIIITEAYADKMVDGWLAFFESYLGIKKKPVTTPSPSITVPTSKPSLKAGQAIVLDKTPTYSTASSQAAASNKSGTYYIWSDEIVKNRIRITNRLDRVGVSGQVTGWINVSDITTQSNNPTTPETTVTPATATITLDVLQLGDEGEQVGTLQILLIAKGYSCGTAGADKKFGNSTLKAVKAYQSNNTTECGVADGIVDEAMWNSLLK